MKWIPSRALRHMYMGVYRRLVKTCECDCQSVTQHRPTSNEQGCSLPSGNGLSGAPPLLANAQPCFNCGRDFPLPSLEVADQVDIPLTGFKQALASWFTEPLPPYHLPAPTARRTLETSTRPIHTLMIHMPLPTHFQSSNRNLPRRVDSLQAGAQAVKNPYFIELDDELRDIRRVHSQGQEEDLRYALSRTINRIEELVRRHFFFRSTLPLISPPSSISHANSRQSSRRRTKRRRTSRQSLLSPSPTFRWPLRITRCSRTP